MNRSGQHPPIAAPRTYRPSGFWLIFFTVAGAVCFMGGAAGLVYTVTQRTWQWERALLLTTLWAGCALMGAWLLLSNRRSRITLSPDRIQIEDATRNLTIRRDEIVGWRRIYKNSPETIVLALREPAGKTVKFSDIFGGDSDFDQWFYTLPNLDAAEARAAKADIRNDANLGSTPGERVRNVAKGRVFARWFNVAAALVIAWAYFYPRPYTAAVLLLAALPVVTLGIIWRSRGLFQIDKYRNDARPTLAVGFMGGGLILAVLAVQYNSTRPWSLAAWTVLFAAALWVAALLSDRSARTRRGTAISIALFCCAWGFGVSVQANALLDRSQGTVYSSVVRGRRVHKSKTTTYSIDIDPWGPIAQSTSLQISRDTFNYISNGDIVLLNLHTGALGVPWYYMSSWERPDSRLERPSEDTEFASIS